MRFESDPPVRFIFTFLPFLAGFVLFFTTCGNLYKSVQAENWLLVQGVAVRNFTQSPDISFRFHFSVKTKKRLYRYSQRGHRYFGDSVGFGVFTGISDINKGDKIGVYVNPEDPAESTLVVGVSNSHIFSLLAAVACFYLGLYLWRRT